LCLCYATHKFMSHLKFHIVRMRTSCQCMKDALVNFDLLYRIKFDNNFLTRLLFFIKMFQSGRCNLNTVTPSNNKQKAIYT